MLLDGTASSNENFWKTDTRCRLVDSGDGVTVSEGIYLCRQTLKFGKEIVFMHRETVLRDSCPFLKASLIKPGFFGQVA
jgi:hypothetical protein